MDNHFNIHNNTVHLWRLRLPDFTEQKAILSTLLSQDEIKRAGQFHFPIHQERFIITRGLLRKTLNFYTDIDPKVIMFHYGEHGKPALNNSNLTFNVSHSHEIAVFAFTIDKSIGIDIEKMTPTFKQDVAQRFFNNDENKTLIQLDEKDRIPAFYKIWSRKEALIKALGKGLFTPLNDFTVSSELESQTVLLENKTYTIQHFNAHPEYQAAFATLVPLTKIIMWDWTISGALKQSIISNSLG